MFLNVCKQTFHIISRAQISKSKRCFDVKSSTYNFHMKILADCQICISVPLIQWKSGTRHESLRPVTLSKKRLWHRWFPVNFATFLRTPIFIEHLWWLLLCIVLYERKLQPKQKLYKDFQQVLVIFLLNFFLVESLACSAWIRFVQKYPKQVFPLGVPLWGHFDQSH